MDNLFTKFAPVVHPAYGGVYTLLYHVCHSCTKFSYYSVHLGTKFSTKFSKAVVLPTAVARYAAQRLRRRLPTTVCAVIKFQVLVLYLWVVKYSGNKNR